MAAGRDPLIRDTSPETATSSVIASGTTAVLDERKIADALTVTNPVAIGNPAIWKFRKLTSRTPGLCDQVEHSISAKT